MNLMVQMAWNVCNNVLRGVHAVVRVFNVRNGCVWSRGREEWAFAPPFMIALFDINSFTFKPAPPHEAIGTYRHTLPVSA